MGGLTEFKRKTEELSFILGVGFAGKIWAKGEPAWIPNILDNLDFSRNQELKRTDIKGVFALPIKIQNEVVAVAEFFSYVAMEPDADMIITTRNISEQMGRVIERKNAEKDIASAQAQLLQSEKLASIGQLAAGVAHEINNPVGFISNNMELLGQYVGEYNKVLMMVEDLKKYVEKGDIEKAKAVIKEINKFEEEIQLDQVMNETESLLKQTQGGIDRIQKIVIDLRAFARENNDTMELVKIEEVIDSILSIVDNELRYKAELKKDYGITPLVRCNTQKLGQVFINLLVNATHAIENKGTIEIKTYQQDKFLCIDIKDTGKGIPPENLKKIFEPFFTTKPVGQGTGLGLSVSYQIIKKHAGNITVQSEVGKGTTFTVMLPIDN
jgi:two-component system NtrC family sensor kinase